MFNTYQQFQDLNPSKQLEIVSITAHNGDGSMTVQTLGGNGYRATGVKVDIGKKAYCDMPTKTIVGEAPNLTLSAITLF